MSIYLSIFYHNDDYLCSSVRFPGDSSDDFVIPIYGCVRCANAMPSGLTVCEMRHARCTAVTTYRRAENNRLWFSCFWASAILYNLLIPAYLFTARLDSQQGLFARETSHTSDLRLGHAASTTFPFLKSFRVFLGDFKVLSTHRETLEVGTAADAA